MIKLITTTVIATVTQVMEILTVMVGTVIRVTRMVIRTVHTETSTVTLLL
jgi:hypothetical protein